MAPEAARLPVLSGALAFRDVTFSYTGEQSILDRISLEIPSGSFVAFVGPSGSGKSTVLNLILRFYDPISGSVEFDGHDVRIVTQESLRAQIGVVFQENVLFNTSVRENIRLGHRAATDEEVEAPARAAEIHDFVVDLVRLRYLKNVPRTATVLTLVPTIFLTLERGQFAALLRQQAPQMRESPLRAYEARLESEE